MPEALEADSHAHTEFISPAKGTESRPQKEQETPSGEQPNGHAIDKETDSWENPLPGDDDLWKQSALGDPSGWDEHLQAFAQTLASFAYPAALFWGEEFVLIHNAAWSDVGGIAEQGQRQRGRLAADAYSSLTAAIHGGKPQKIASRELLRSGSKDQEEKYVVVVSPLFLDGGEGHEPCGLLAQLLPKPGVDGKPKEDEQQSKHRSFGHSDLDKNHENLDISQLGKVVDNVPLDEHPFFHRFAEMLPSGLAILDHRAQAVFVNQHFYQLTTHRGDDKSFRSWPQSIHPDDYDRVMNAYHEAFESQRQLRTEFRAQTDDPNPWRLLLLTPLGDENLQHVSLRDYGGFICSIVDISSEKSAELSERKAAKEARERKEQQERFIDMISHEIRNPLSAVMHCSEDIEDAVRDRHNVDFDMIKEAVETINLCISHQRNIVDDVLSFSKLDASMLSLVPKSCQPSRQLVNSLKMFQPEFRKQHISFGFRIDTSYVDYGVEWVMADISRIGQVLINLVSNAIKFTARGEGEKKIVVSLGAAKERPQSYPPNVVFFSSEATAYKMDRTNTKDWGNCEAMYIMIAVKDTGIGISEEGQKRLFERFRQATPKTEELYGGSGLGLNISRKLCHLHGGEIGCSAKEGEGSTFGFFFRVKRSERPGDYEGRPEEDTMDDEEMRKQVKQLGNASPDEMNTNFMPESLKSPPVEKAEETTPNPTGKPDQRFENTSEIASEVAEPDPDQYQIAENPQASKELRDGEQIQSKDVSTPGSSTQEHQDQPLPHRPNAPNRANTRCHVLLVEDNVINQRIVFRKLQAKGFNVTTANNGQDAVDAVRQAPKPSTGDKAAFDIILMDQEMPVMDGNAATREIRRLEEEGEIEKTPIVGVTANVRGAQQDEMVKSGMNEVISKPYKIEDMVKKINEVTGSTPTGSRAA